MRTRVSTAPNHLNNLAPPRCLLPLRDALDQRHAISYAELYACILTMLNEHLSTMAGEASRGQCRFLAVLPDRIPDYPIVIGTAQYAPWLMVNHTINLAFEYDPAYAPRLVNLMAHHKRAFGVDLLDAQCLLECLPPADYAPPQRADWNADVHFLCAIAHLAIRLVPNEGRPFAKAHLLTALANEDIGPPAALPQTKSTLLIYDAKAGAFCIRAS